MPSSTIPVNITTEQHAVLKKHAALWGMSMSELIRLSIAWYIKHRIKKKSRFTFPTGAKFNASKLNRKVLEEVYGDRSSNTSNIPERPHR